MRPASTRRRGTTRRCRCPTVGGTPIPGQQRQRHGLDLLVAGEHRLAVGVVSGHDSSYLHRPAPSCCQRSAKFASARASMTSGPNVGGGGSVGDTRACDRGSPRPTLSTSRRSGATSTPTSRRRASRTRRRRARGGRRAAEPWNTNVASGSMTGPRGESGTTDHDDVGLLAGGDGSHDARRARARRRRSVRPTAARRRPGRRAARAWRRRGARRRCRPSAGTRSRGAAG